MFDLALCPLTTTTTNPFKSSDGTGPNTTCFKHFHDTCFQDLAQDESKKNSKEGGMIGYSTNMTSRQHLWQWPDVVKTEQYHPSLTWSVAHSLKCFETLQHEIGTLPWLEHSSKLCSETLPYLEHSLKQQLKLVTVFSWQFYLFPKTHLI